MKAMILAAGLGTRLRPITDTVAKPAVPFLNIPLLYYSVALLEQAGVDSLVLNTHYKAEQVEAVAKRIPGFTGSVAFSHEPGAPLGSGGGIWKARQNLLSDHFFLANADEVILPHDPQILQRLMTEHRESHALATILVMRHPLVGTQFGGVWADQDGNVRGFGKDGKQFGSDVSGYHYIGLQMLNPRILNYLPEGESNILYDGIAAGIKAGEIVRVIESSFTWYETGNPKDFMHASGDALKLLAESADNEATRFLRRMCRRFWTPGTELKRTENGVFLLGANSIIEPGATLKGFAVIADNTLIKTNTTIENTVVFESAGSYS